MALARIAQEHADLQRDPLETCSAGPAGSDNLRRWVGHVTGPPDTPYEHKNLPIAIVFPENYPFKPFQITFTAPLSHPNVSEEGEVRLAELEDNNWSPVLTVRSILICLQALLSDPYPLKGVMNSEAARVCSTNNSQEHDIGSNATKGCTEPIYHGRKIEGKTYGIDISRPDFKEYENLTKEEEKDKFFIKNADIIRDM
jgi:ubiquitin-protein ligase